MMPEDHCLSHADLRYDVALRSSNGRDRPDLSRELLVAMQIQLPEAWQMLSDHHPIQDIAPGIPGLPTGPIDDAAISLRVADWPLDRTSRILTSTCLCGRAQRTIIVNARTLDLFTYIHAAISSNVTTGRKCGQPTLRFDGARVDVDTIRARLAASMSTAPMAAALHKCQGDTGLRYDSILQCGLAFLVAHEACHAHITETDYSQGELKADYMAAATLRHRANYLWAETLGINARYKEHDDPEEPLKHLFCGVELLLHHLDFERAYIRSSRRGEVRISDAPSPEKRFEPIQKTIEIIIKLGLMKDYWAWRLPFLTFWEDIAARLEIAHE